MQNVNNTSYSLFKSSPERFVVIIDYLMDFWQQR